ncbi:cytosolic phospholipase A2 epsilon-like [Crotalus adamanteus]|uniref:Cytosolic phospholipase A2 epsilon-like n=1 Tax=Crotalus adamanteus TaxID=8729 RepID=A0AAW1C5H5_CROAD
MAVNEGQNPFPIYLAVNLKDNYSAQDFKEWLEFTPYEVGSIKYGAYIRSEDFGNDFFMGRLMKKFPEIRICFMQGVERSSTNMEEGNVDISSVFSPFGTREVSFSEDNFDKLVKLTEYNILNNESKIIEAFRAAVHRKKNQKNQK